MYNTVLGLKIDSALWGHRTKSICVIEYVCEYKSIFETSIAEPHQCYAAPAPGENFDAAPAALAPTLLYSKAKFLKRTKVYTHVETILFI
jgi:hypothetical protein